MNFHLSLFSLHLHSIFFFFSSTHMVRCIMCQCSFNNNYPFYLVFCSHSIQFIISTTQANSNDCLVMMGGVNTNVKGQRGKFSFYLFALSYRQQAYSDIWIQSRAEQPILPIFTKVSTVAIFKYHLTLCSFVFSIDCNFFKRSNFFTVSILLRGLKTTSVQFDSLVLQINLIFHFLQAYLPYLFILLTQSTSSNSTLQFVSNSCIFPAELVQH